jgi:hypothetical protein
MIETPLSLRDISPKGENKRWSLLNINSIPMIFPLPGGIKGGFWNNTENNQNSRKIK